MVDSCSTNFHKSQQNTPQTPNLKTMIPTQPKDTRLVFRVEENIKKHVGDLSLTRTPDQPSPPTPDPRPPTRDRSGSLPRRTSCALSGSAWSRSAAVWQRWPRRLREGGREVHPIPLGGRWSSFGWYELSTLYQERRYVFVENQVFL